MAAIPCGFRRRGLLYYCCPLQTVEDLHNADSFAGSQSEWYTAFQFFRPHQNRRHAFAAFPLSAAKPKKTFRLCLGDIGGAISNFVGIFREPVFINREEQKLANHTAWLLLFIAMNFALGLASFRTLINIDLHKWKGEKNHQVGSAMTIFEKHEN